MAGRAGVTRRGAVEQERWFAFPTAAWRPQPSGGLRLLAELVCHESMDQLVAKHADKLQGTLSCFDRVLFRGYLPFFSGYAMASFLDTRGIRRRGVKHFVLTQAYRLKDHARQMATRAATVAFNRGRCDL